MLKVRKAVAADIDGLIPLLERFMRETFAAEWNGNREALLRDGLGSRFDLFVAESEERLIGFAGVAPDYDLHNCVHGGVLMDMFVEKAWRGRGVAAHMITLIAVEIEGKGGRYVKTQATAEESKALARRVAVTFPGVHCVVGGRAFRRLAELHGCSAREILRWLPPRSWNWEP